MRKKKEANVKKKFLKKRLRKPIFQVIRGDKKRLLRSDNIKSKLQNHFLKFLFNFIRVVINEELSIDISFNPFKIKPEKGSLKKKTIKELLSIDNNENKINIDSIIKNNPKLEIFFNTRALKIFEIVYYANKRSLDLNEFGIDKKINELGSELKLYDNFIEKNNSIIKKNPEYLQKIKSVIKNEFTDKIFNITFCGKNVKFNK